MTDDARYLFLSPRKSTRRVSFGINAAMFGRRELKISPGGTAILLSVTQDMWKEATEDYGGRLTVILPKFEAPAPPKPRKKKAKKAPRLAVVPSGPPPPLLPYPTLAPILSGPLGLPSESSWNRYSAMRTCCLRQPVPVPVWAPWA